MAQKHLTQVGIWWRWMLATLVGLGLGSVLVIPVSYLGLHFLGPWLIDRGLCEAGSGNLGCILRSGIGLASLITALALSILQRLLIARFVQRSWWWVLVSVFGWTIVAMSLSEFAYTPISGQVLLADGSIQEITLGTNLGKVAQGLAGTIGTGLLLGGLQWLVLTNYLTHSLWWVLVNGVLVMFAAIVILFLINGSGGLGALWLFFSLFLPIHGAITGATLAKIVSMNQTEVNHE